MRPLLQHASRSLTANKVVSSSSSFGSFFRTASSVCSCQYRTASEASRWHGGVQLSPHKAGAWSRRAFGSSARWREEDRPPKPSDPIAMPPPASESKPIPPPPTKLSGSSPSPEDQERLQRRLDALLEDQKAIKRAAENAEAALKEPPPAEVPEPPPPEPAPPPPKDEAVDTIARVPDEKLPSHRERQRWSLSKRFSDAMDDLLPKLAVVTQKVNTYTGTDYSGVEALRREIKEQEKLVKARRLAIDSAKQALDTALAHQATSQKEVVALLERKHSWSNGDLERYMALIRSEHINDQAVREAKDAVANAENALEDARAQLEKRERAQYHEEQIWSDTIRRNSTWVTFGLMGVNIFLLLLSLAILEPWRRRRMVREIKTVLETQQKVAMDAASVAAPAAAVAPTSAQIDTVIEQAPPTTATPPTIVEEAVEESPTAGTLVTDPVEAEIIPEPISEAFVDPTPDSATPEPEPLTQEEAAMTAEERIAVATEAAPSREPYRKFETWQEKATFLAQDIISERVISMRRIDYTTAILQGAAAGAIIAATIISMLKPN